MTSRDVAALGGTLAQFVSIVQDLGNNYFRADVAWNDFPSRVALLRAIHDGLVESVERYGLPANTSEPLLEAVKEAKQQLDGEVAALKKRRAESGARKWYQIRGVLYNASVETHIAAAEGAYSRISNHLNSQLQNDKVLRETAQRRAFRLPFHNDSRYVPFHDSEQKIFSALEGAGQKPAVVLLSGGPGKGKSTLARQVSLRYRDENATFTQVVMLECGPKIDVAGKQTELLQKLGEDLSQQSEGDNFKVFKSLQDRLSNPRMLIVLDDLWETELISILINLSGPRSGSKYLITSQRGNICDSLNCRDRTLVQIEDLDQDHANKILALHSGFEDQIIPQNLQEVADKIIGQSGANPLVMATLGAQITNAGRDRVEVWESVSDNLFALLDSRTLVNVHGVGYQRTFWATMKLSIDALSQKQKQLLVLMAICRGASIPESALQFLYGSAILHERCKIHDFLALRNELKGRHLVAENNVDFLSIHSLTRKFILEHMREDVKDVITLLIEAKSDMKGKASNVTSRTSVTDVLVYLYIDPECSTNATMQTLSDHLSDLHVSDEVNRATVDYKKTTSEPIMKLLVLTASPSNTWTEELRICAEQVLVEFISNDFLCDGDISKLLASPTAIIPLLTFLKNVCLLEETFWKKNFIQPSSNIPRTLVRILQDYSCADYQTRVASVLAGLCGCYKDNSETLVDVPGALSQLATSLAQTQNPDLQRNAAIALSACAYWDDDRHNDIIPKILGVPGLLKSLVDLLAEDENPSVQIAVGHALSNLASVEPTKMKETIAKQRGLLAGLADSLLRSRKPHLQEYAARTIANLALTEEQAICDNIASYPGLVNKLVKSLKADRNPIFQEHAARALQSLAATDICRSTLAECPDLLEELARSLTKSGNPILQETAAATLANLADTDDNTILVELLDHSGLVKKLVKSLYKNENAGLQKEAARALCNLGRHRTASSTFDELMDWDGLLQGIANSSHNTENPPFEVNVVGTHSNMQLLVQMITHSETNDSQVVGLRIN